MEKYLQGMATKYFLIVRKTQLRGFQISYKFFRSSKMILCAIFHFFSQSFFIRRFRTKRSGRVLTNLVELFNFVSTLEAINKKQIELKYILL